MPATHDGVAPDATFRLPTAARVAIPLAWATALLVVLGQNALLARLGLATSSFSSILRSHGPYALAWALATPFILGSARRWPVHGSRWLHHLSAHGACGLAFVVATNAVMRLPLLDTPALWAEDLAAGLLTFAPWALLAYALIVALGHARAQTVDHAATEPTEIALKAQNGTHVTLIPPAEIDWIDAAGNYVRVRTETRTWLLRQPLLAIEETLPPDDFIRIHRSTIVALRAIREVQPRTHGDAVVILRDGTSFRVPRTRRESLSAALESMSTNG